MYNILSKQTYDISSNNTLTKEFIMHFSTEPQNTERPSMNIEYSGLLFVEGTGSELLMLE